jgi:hypothetical protein
MHIFRAEISMLVAAFASIWTKVAGKGCRVGRVARSIAAVWDERGA